MMIELKHRLLRQSNRKKDKYEKKNCVMSYSLQMSEQETWTWRGKFLRTKPKGIVDRRKKEKCSWAEWDQTDRDRKEESVFKGT